MCNSTTRNIRISRLSIETTEASPLCYSSCFEFLVILNALTRNDLSEAVVLGKSLRSP